MAKFSVMDASGHSDVLEYDRTDALSVAKAMKRFDEIMSEGGRTAATRKSGASDYKVTRSFDPTADETLFVSPMQGG